MSLGIPENIWLVITVAGICTSFILSEISSLNKIITRMEKRGMDIEYKLHLLQQNIGELANSVEGVENNTRP